MALDDKKNVGEANSIELPKGCYIEGSTVYEFVVGGKPRQVGFVENGVPYEFVVGGSPRPITGMTFK